MHTVFWSRVKIMIRSAFHLATSDKLLEFVLLSVFVPFKTLVTLSYQQHLGVAIVHSEGL